MRKSDSDAQLIGSCLNGERSSWKHLIEKYDRLIYASILNRLKKYGFTLPSQDIDDIRQNILTDIWGSRKLETVKNREDISYWLAIVSGNAAMEFVRTGKTREVPKPLSEIEELADKLTEAGCATVRHPADALSQSELAEKAAKEIERLPPREALIIKLNLYHDKKYGEIARMLGIPRGTVSSYIKRAKEKIREKLKDF
jgi:RNA polymerase sigma-70 factor (ECF subfamily)